MKSINIKRLSLFFSFLGSFFSLHIHAADHSFVEKNFNFSFADARSEIITKLKINPPLLCVPLSWLGKAWLEYALNEDQQRSYYTTTDGTAIRIPEETILTVQLNYSNAHFTKGDLKCKTGLILRAIGSFTGDEAAELKNLLYSFYDPKDSDVLLNEYKRSLEFAGHCFLIDAVRMDNAGALFEIGCLNKEKKDFTRALQYFKCAFEQNHLKAKELYYETLKDLESNSLIVDLKAITDSTQSIDDLSRLASSKRYVIFRNLKNKIHVPKQINQEYLNSPLERFLRFTLTMIAQNKEIIFYVCPFEFSEIPSRLLDAKKIKPIIYEEALEQFYNYGCYTADDNCLNWYFDFEEKINNRTLLHFIHSRNSTTFSSYFLIPEHCSIEHEGDTLNIEPVNMTWHEITINKNEERKLFVEFQKEAQGNRENSAHSSDEDGQSFYEYLQEHFED